MANIEIRDRMKCFLPETRKRMDIDQVEGDFNVNLIYSLCTLSKHPHPDY